MINIMTVVYLCFFVIFFYVLYIAFIRSKQIDPVTREFSRAVLNILIDKDSGQEGEIVKVQDNGYPFVVATLKDGRTCDVNLNNLQSDTIRNLMEYTNRQVFIHDSSAQGLGERGTRYKDLYETMEKTNQLLKTENATYRSRLRNGMDDALETLRSVQALSKADSSNKAQTTGGKA